MSRLVAFLFVLASLLISPQPAAAQDYLFEVSSLEMTVTVQPDASVRVVYDIAFANRPGAHPIDVVDIGLPAKGAFKRDMKAVVAGHPVIDIRDSEYVKPGVEIHLGGSAIAAGESGSFHFEFTQPDLVFADVTSDALASLRITPTWFSEDFVKGTTDIEISVIVPGDLKPDEVVWQQQTFSQKALFDGGVAVLFSFPASSLTGPHPVGLSFPRRVMDRVVTQSTWDLAVKWFVERPRLRLAWAAGLLAMFTFVFFRFSGRTGCVVFGLLAAGALWLFAASPGAQLLAPLPLALLLVFNESALRRRKGAYLPPIAEVEGGGIKRGLTAPEAAVLLELPFGKVLQLVMVGLLKKGVLRLAPADLNRAVAGEGYEGVIADRSALQAAAAKRGVVLADYETDFAALATSQGAADLSGADFTKVLRVLILGVSKRMKGFDLSDTQGYYRQVIVRALREVEGLPNLSDRRAAADETLEWLLMDGAGASVLARPSVGYRPIWFPATSHGGGSSAPSPAVRSGASGATSLSDVAAGFAGWAENTAGGLAATLTPASLGIEGGAKGGFLDLSGVDRVTSKLLSAMASSRGGSGGSSGGGCACACAGCACACACAGGGR